MSTTLGIDDPVLRQLRRRQKGSGKSLGQIANDRDFRRFDFLEVVDPVESAVRDRRKRAARR